MIAGAVRFHMSLFYTDYVGFLFRSPRGSRYLIIEASGPKSHSNHGL